MKEKIEPCLWCPEGGDVSVACTDMEHRDEFQVWCRQCWAHGPSRKTRAEAVLSWNEAAGPIRPGVYGDGKRMIAIEARASQAGGCNGCSRRVRYVWVIHLGQTLEWRLCRQCRDKLVEQTKRER